MPLRETMPITVMNPTQWATESVEAPSQGAEILRLMAEFAFELLLQSGESLA